MIYERLDASDFERRMRESGWNFLNGELLQDLFFYLEDEDGDMEFDVTLIDSDFIPYHGWVDLVDEGAVESPVVASTLNEAETKRHSVKNE